MVGKQGRDHGADPDTLVRDQQNPGPVEVADVTCVKLLPKMHLVMRGHQLDGKRGRMLKQVACDLSVKGMRSRKGYGAFQA